jgi:predicted membrane GTPase involved in stress response
MIYYGRRGLVGLKGVFNSHTRGTGFMHRAFQGMMLIIIQWYIMVEFILQRVINTCN